MPPGWVLAPGPGRGWRRLPDEDIFRENSLCGYRTLRRRVLELFGPATECTECGQEPFWNGLPLTLQLDHANGINNDHRLENLRWLCPNCHTQTPTYAGKNQRRVA